MTLLQDLKENWPFFIVVFIVCMICEKINIISIPVGIGQIMFLPMLFAMVITLVLYLIKGFPFISPAQHAISDVLVVVGISTFIAKVSVVSGVAIPQVIAAGPALLLQELGNLGTMLIALPVALLFGFKREAIGMTHSIAREPNVAVIAQKYGLNSPEGEGVIMTYVVGTLVGTIFMGLLASIMATATPLSPLAMAMACGVGSGSMMAASSAPLIANFPELETEITAFAATSNVLSTADTVFITVLIGLPLCTWLYNKLEPKLGKGKQAKKVEMSSAAASFEEPTSERSTTFGGVFLENLIIILITGFISWIGNWIYSKGSVTLGETIPGIVILMAIALVGLVLAQLVPKIPAVIWITVLGILLAMPYNPATANIIVEPVGKIQMLPLATPILAYAGVTMGKNWADFKRIGWKGILIACLVMFGTFIGSAIIAQIVLSATGVI